ncbi:MAG: permease [Synergistetes bacterium]|nr:permease [Synergistota bacterium]MDW8192380.1 hypothetical protein [Synergistota bacterium]
MKKLFEDYPVELSIALLTLSLVLLKPDRMISGLIYAVKTYIELFPMVLSVAFLAGLISELLTSDLVKKIVGKESGFKGMLIGATFGALMVGPAYVFYPLFRDLIDKGASLRVIAATIGAWAIRLQAVPLAVAILGFKFILFFNLLIFVYALVSGFVIGFFCEKG